MTSGHANWPSGWHVRQVSETGSTNTDLYAEALAGAPHHSALMAGHQTAGQGRLNRTWQAQSGTNLLVSLLFRNTHDALQWHPRIVALAAVRACERVAPGCIALKWPNDLLCRDRKLGGMLSVGDPQHAFVVVGIGINIAWAPPSAVALCSIGAGATPTPAQLLAQLLQEIDTVEGLDASTRHAQYVASLTTLGRRVRVELTNGDVVVGLARDLDNDGRLIVEDNAGTLFRVDTGDVVHLHSATNDK